MFPDVILSEVSIVVTASAAKNLNANEVDRQRRFIVGRQSLFRRLGMCFTALRPYQHRLTVRYGRITNQALLVGTEYVLQL